jgi:replicative DNA helicase
MGKSALAANIGFDVARNYAWEPQPDGSHKTVRGGRGGLLLAGNVRRAAGACASWPRSRASPPTGCASGDIEAHEFGRVRDAAMEIQDAPLYIDDTGGLSIAKLAPGRGG